MEAQGEQAAEVNAPLVSSSMRGSRPVLLYGRQSGKRGWTRQSRSGQCSPTIFLPYHTLLSAPAALRAPVPLRRYTPWTPPPPVPTDGVPSRGIPGVAPSNPTPSSPIPLTLAAACCGRGVVMVWLVCGLYVHWGPIFHCVY